MEQRLTFLTPAVSFIDPRNSKIKLCSTPNPGRKSLAQTQFIGHWPLIHWNLYVFYKSLNALFWLIGYLDMSSSSPGAHKHAWAWEKRYRERDDYASHRDPSSSTSEHKGREGKLPQQGSWNARRSTSLMAQCSAVLCTKYQLIIPHCTSAKADLIKIINQSCISVGRVWSWVCSLICTSSKMRALVKSWAFSTLSSLKMPEFWVQRCWPLSANPKSLKSKADYKVNIPTFPSRPCNPGQEKEMGMVTEQSS